MPLPSPALSAHREPPLRPGGPPDPAEPPEPVPMDLPPEPDHPHPVQQPRQRRAHWQGPRGSFMLPAGPPGKAQRGPTGFGNGALRGRLSH